MTERPTDLDATIADAFHYAFAVHDLARTRWNATQGPDPARRVAVNALSHQRALAGPSFRAVTQPNNDTLYTIAWLDLSGGPVRLSIPAMGGRYWSFALLDPFTDNAAIVSRRTDGGGPCAWWLLPPGHAADPPGDAPALRMPAHDLWLLGRVLIDGEADAPAVHALQDAMRLQAEPGLRPFAAVPDERDPRRFLALVNETLGRNPVPGRDRPLLARIATAGVVPGEPHAWDALDEPVREAWTRLLPQLRRALRPDPARLAAIGPYWFGGADAIGRFGDDHAYRAFIALFGLGALPRDEAIYATAGRDADGRHLDGANAYTLTVPADLPIDGFWSLSMYRLEPDGRAFFVDNPIGRWTIGDRTPGVVREADGSLVVHLRHAPPDDARARANWLPAPDGRFILTWRLYEPREALVSRRYEVPGVRLRAPAP